jgi:hypothetical protein
MAVVTSCTLGVGLMFSRIRDLARTSRRVPPESFPRSHIRYGLLCAPVAVVFINTCAATESAARAQDAERDRLRFVSACRKHD